MNPAELQWIDQSAFDLRLRVFAGPLDRTRLHVLRETTLCRDGLHLWVAIIGSSHALHLTAQGDRHLSELCSCQDAGMAPRPLQSIRLCERRHRTEIDNGGLRYRFASATHSWADGLHHAARIRAAAQQGRHTGETGLLFAFPTSGDCSPFTALTASADSGCVRIETVHAYPNEKNIVLTTSAITLT